MSSLPALTPPQRRSTEGTSYGLAYYRVSTSDQANTSYDEDGFSIQAQREYCQRKAAEMGVQLIDEFVDRGKSARTADRPALQAMLSRIKEDTDIQFVFVHKLDRLARNRHDDVQIGLLLTKCGVRLVSCTENIDDSPSGKLVHGIMADIAEWYSANLSEEAKKGMRKKVEHGGTPFMAPLGYVNTRLKLVELGKDIGVVQVHETYGPIITECFRRYDSGRYTLDALRDFATARGLRVPANKRLPERPISTSWMQQILRNRYYTGYVRYNGIEYRGEHPPLIDEDTFGRVQALLTARNTNKDKSHKRPHHLKGFLYCARCGRRLGITIAKGRRRDSQYPYFYCLGRQADTQKTCPQGYVAIDEVEAAVRDYLARVHISAERRSALRIAILARFTGEHERGASEIAKQKRSLTALEQRRDKAKAAYFAGALTVDEFKIEQESLRQATAAAQEIIAQWSVELDSITASLDDALRLMEDPQSLYDALPEGLKVLLIQAVFEKVWIVDRRAVWGDFTQPFAQLLAVDAQLALHEQRLIDTAQARQSGKPVLGATATGDTEGRTEYHRAASTRAPLPDVWERTWGDDARHTLHPSPTPQETQKQGPHGGPVSNIHSLVGLSGFNLKRPLARFLEEHPNFPQQPVSSHPLYPSPMRKRRRVRERLTKERIVTLIAAFTAGTPKHVLAERYGISMKSVKRLLREEGVKRRSRWDVRGPTD